MEYLPTLGLFSMTLGVNGLVCIFQHHGSSGVGTPKKPQNPMDPYPFPLCPTKKICSLFRCALHAGTMAGSHPRISLSPYWMCRSLFKQGLPSGYVKIAIENGDL